MRSISAQAQGQPHGFDHVRLWMALWVIVLHSVALTSDSLPVLATRGEFHVLVATPVPVFFAVSGFLVSQSASRNSTAAFAAYRLLRLMPGLIAVVLLSVFVAGPLLTSLSIGDYFASPKTWSQFGVLVGATRTEVPGFGGHNFSDFNGSLWTIPWEMGCYLWLGLSAAFGLFQKPWPAVLLAAGLCAANVLQALTTEVDPAVASPLFLETCFAIGAALYALRDRVVASLGSGLAALAVALLIIYLGGVQFAALPLSYAAIAIGLQPMPRLAADWSYGIYISAYPMQQWLSNESWGRVWWVNAMLTTIWACAYAAASWRFIERPAMSLKPKVRAWLESLNPSKARPSVSAEA